jgi:hypothetical protein
VALETLDNTGLTRTSHPCYLRTYDADDVLLSETRQDIVAIDSQVGEREVIRSDTTPNFHKLLREGELIPFTHLHVKQVKTSHVLNYCYGEHELSAGQAETDAPGPVGGVNSFSAQVEIPSELSYDPLLTEALGEAKEGALYILLELAEAPKTVELFTSFTRNLRKRRDWLFDTFRKKYRKRQDLADAHRILGEMWLEYRYGWSQLVYTSEDILRALEILSTGKKFTVVTGKGFASQSLTGDVSSLTYSVPFFGHKKSTSTEVTATLEQRAAVSLQVSTAGAAFDTNLLALGWELTPWSFVVDWFVNIGDVARAVWPVASIAESACTSWKITKKLSVELRRDPVGGLVTAPGHFEYSIQEYKRTPFTGEIPIVFNVDPKLGLKRIIDAIFLAKSDWLRHNRNPYRA